LIVEDCYENRLLLRDLLGFYGYETAEACDGAEGFRLAKEFMPDLIFMDIQMPVKDGFDAVKLIRSHPRTRGIIVVALTSFAMKGDGDRILAAGFDAYIAKPINTRMLPKMINQFLSAKARV
jgi:two-component system cell cycle response regulator DivK